MQVVFISNYINHHQKPFCDAMYDALGDDFIFVESEPMEEERKNMGWGLNPDTIPYVRCIYDDDDRLGTMLMNADVVMAGWTSKIELVVKRMEAGKLTVRISERIYREGQWKAVSPRGLIAKYHEHTRFRGSKAYMLCAGAYVPSDFNIVKAYPDKMYKFGYFPPKHTYDLEDLFLRKDASGKINIIFAGRFMPLKHPEYMLYLAKDIVRENKRRIDSGEGQLPDFKIHMVGSGEMDSELKNMAEEFGVLNLVEFYGFKSPDEVRTIMEESHIQVFPSNHLEGWGAVVNEGMNSACAVVASVEAGAVPFLIRQWDNGVAYPDNDYNKLKEAVIYLMEHTDERKRMGIKAYETITNKWNAENAAKTLITMMEGWMDDKELCPSEGPLSKAGVISPGRMFQHMEKVGINGGR